MSIFGLKKSYIGVDLGTSAIKMVELQNKSGRPLLLTYGYVEKQTDIIRSSSSEMEEQIIKIIKAIYAQSRMTSKKVIAALPSFSVFNSIINLPNMNKKDLAQAVKWEAKKFIPLPLEEMTLDWKIISDSTSKEKARSINAKEVKKTSSDNSTSPIAQDKMKAVASDLNTTSIEQQSISDLSKETQPEEVASKFNFSKIFKNPKSLFEKKNKDSGFGTEIDKNNIKILLTAAPKSLVEKYVRIFKAADLELFSLETESFALERSLAGGDSAPIMIIDIGSVSSDVSLIDNGIPILTRSIDVGGSAITQAVMNSLNVDLARAEQFKKDIGFSTSGPGDLPEIIKNTITPIVNEVKYSLDIYLSQNKGHGRLEKIILTGGNAFLPELVNYLTKILDIKVIIGDPWDRIIYPLELKPVLSELGPRFSVAIGLAMREI